MIPETMRGEDGKFIPQPDSLHPKPACIKLPKHIRDWIKSKGTEFHRQLVIDAWKAEVGKNFEEISSLTQTEPSPQTQATLTAIACPKCTCNKFQVFLSKQKDEGQPQLQCTFCSHVISL